MAVDADVLEQIRERLRVSTRVGDDRIEVATRADDPMDTEPASPAGDEVLIGSTDMLAGPDAAPTEDLAEALDENEPWSPPDVPQLAPTATEQRGGWARENALALSEWEEGGQLPSLDPTAATPEDRAAREELEEGEG